MVIRRRARTPLGRLVLTLTLSCLVSFVIAMFNPGHARAHEQDPNIVAVTDQITPQLPGVSVHVETGPFSLLALTNRTPTDVEVLDANGQPFLKVGPSGVLANLHQPSWYESNSPAGTAQLPQPLPQAQWGRVSDTPQWAWFEHRLHPGGLEALPGQSHLPVRLAEWSVPLRQGSVTATVHGHFEYRPVLGHAEARMTSPAQLAPGITAAVVSGRTPGVFLKNSTTQTVLVIGRAGEPFARISPAGVDVNLHSLTWADDQRARGLTPPVQSDAAAVPQWSHITSVTSFTWLESRAGRDTAAQPVPDPEVPATIGNWGVPVKFDSGDASIQGTIEWMPAALPEQATQSDASWGDLVVAGAGGLAGLTAILLWARLRRRRASSTA